MDFSNFELVFTTFNDCTKVNDYKYIWKNPETNDYYVERRGTSIVPYENADNELFQAMLDALWFSGYAITNINDKYKDLIKEKFHGKYRLD